MALRFNNNTKRAGSVLALPDMLKGWKWTAQDEEAALNPAAADLATLQEQDEAEQREQ